MGLIALIVIALVLICLGGTAWLIRGIMRPPRKTYAQALGRGEPTDPADLQLEAKEVRWTLSDGSHSPGWMIAGEEPTGPTVVIVHGYADSRFGALQWSPLVTPLARQVVVFDLPGHGDAEAKNSQGGMREPADVLAVIEQILAFPVPSRDATRCRENAAKLQTSPRPGVVLMGYSLGAQIAIAAAALAAKRGQNDLIRGVIAEGPYRYWDEPIIRLLRMQHYPRQPFIFLAGLVFRLTVPGFKDFDRAGQAARMKCPLLVLHGTDDELCPYESAKQIAAAAPCGELVSFEGGHHLDLAMIDPLRYREALERFFQRIS